jgi:membrane protease YdiL (CAAX protease family)
MALLPALVEEIAFRGVIFDSLDDLLGRRELIIATALMFMILHLAMLSIIFLVVMGLSLGWLRHRSGSIWPPVALHFLHNSIVILWSLALTAGR